MKVILDIPENKAAFVMELFNNMTFIKIKTISAERAHLLEEVKEAVDNLNLVKKGFLKAKPVKELLDEI